MKSTIILYVLFLVSIRLLHADEGMWIPMLLGEQKIKDMNEKGLKLTADDLYSVNNASMKDAVVIFGGGCTGELVSDEGLLFTNHHCGLYYIQRHSSVERDYLTDGFWAKTKEEELPDPGLSVTFLIRMDDVTGIVMEGISDTMDEADRYELISERIRKITEEAVEGTHYEAAVQPFFCGNQYYLFVNEVFRDIRLVGAPPSSIGKFGGDTDNWMWPRHTGDFSLFRIYADKDNRPADYSPENVPYKPKKYFPVSLNGVRPGDFTMVYGYPGTTTEYLTSDAVKMITGTENPHQINLRAHKLEILDKYMATSDELRIAYTSDYARIANYWKKWIGENRGLKKLHAVEKKEEQENNFIRWVSEDNDRTKRYGELMPQFKRIYADIEPYALIMDYLNEVPYAIDLFLYSRQLFKYMNQISSDISDTELKKEIQDMKLRTVSHFSNFHKEVDKELFASLFQIFYDSISIQPGIFDYVNEKFNGNFSEYADFLYKGSALTSEEKMIGLLEKGRKGLKKFEKDPAINLFISVNEYHRAISLTFSLLNHEIETLNRKYLAALMEMESDSIFYPDANSTLRIAYGVVDDYFPRDAVKYDYCTTLSGIIEKNDPDVYDYNVPGKLKQLFKDKDYGPYGEDGVMKVCFIASNHTTGGNSGSPVLNADGELIGINFDRNWEGTMSDIMYDPDQCRNIVLDIRYALFIIDKFAGASHLVDEMTIVQGQRRSDSSP